MAARRSPKVARAALTLALVLVAPEAHAATFAVGTGADGVDASPDNGACESPCTLRAAVQTANGAGAPGPDVITIPALRVELTEATADTGGPDASIGDLDITESVRIAGAGQADTVLDANAIHRVLDGQRDASLTLEQLTITGGNAPADALFGERVGGGVRGQGTTEVNDVTFAGNVARHGGGIASSRQAAGDPAPIMTLNRITATGNTADLGSAVNERFGGTLTLNDSVLRDNFSIQGTVTENGGGEVIVNRTLINGTREPPGTSVNTLGAGVHATGGGPVTINASTITENEADAGGGVSSSGGGRVTITDTSIVGNRATSTREGGGGIVNESGDFTISRSLIAGNSTARTGGGIEHLTDDTMTILSTTISGNRAESGGGALNTDEASSTFVLNNVTMEGNTSGSGGETIDALPAGDVRLRNTIVGGGCAGEIVSLGTNVGRAAGCGLTAASDRTSLDPLTDALGANGGPTLTHALRTGSPAIDRGTGCETTDQRGTRRPQGAGCDIGAFEVVPPTEPPTGGPPQTTPTPTVVARPPAPPPIATPPRRLRPAEVLTLPSARRCVSRRRFRIRIRRPGGVELVSATVTVDGRRVRVVRGARLRSRVDLRGLPRGRFTVRITVVTADGQRLSGTRRYRTCTPRRRGGGRPGPL